MMTAILGSWMVWSGEFHTTFETTSVQEKMKAPKRAPTAIKAPPAFPAAPKEARISGAPLAKAIKVIAAMAGDSWNFLERFVIPDARYLSATAPMHMKSTGKRAQINKKMRIAFSLIDR